jgi:hypothetical protein
VQRRARHRQKAKAEYKAQQHGREAAVGMVVQRELQRSAASSVSTEAQKLLLEHMLRDGEALVQHIDADNPFGYALKFWNVDWLDEMYNEELSGGRRIIMSVEVDATINRSPIG